LLAQLLLLWLGAALSDGAWLLLAFIGIFRISSVVIKVPPLNKEDCSILHLNSGCRSNLDQVILEELRPSLLTFLKDYPRRAIFHLVNVLVVI
jgi:hypothetical protein